MATVGSLVVEMRTNTAKFSRGVGGARNDLKRFRRSAETTRRAMRGLFAVTGASLGVGSIATLADSYHRLEQQVKTASKGLGDYRIIMDELYATAQKNGQSLESTAKLFQKVAIASKALGATKDEVIQLTSTVQGLGRLGGSSAEEIKFSLRQLGQGLAEGIFRAQEFNSVVENTPLLAMRLEKSMGFMPGTMRKAVVAGEVLSKDVFRALLTLSEQVAKEIKTLPDNLQTSSTKMRNSLQQMVGELDNVVGATTGLATGMAGAADSLSGFASNKEAVQALSDSLGLAAKAAAAFFIASKAGPLVASLSAATAAQAKNTATILKGTNAEMRAIQIERAREAAVKKRAVSEVRQYAAQQKRLQAELKAQAIARLTVNTTRQQAFLSTATTQTLRELNRVTAAKAATEAVATGAATAHIAAMTRVSLAAKASAIAIKGLNGAMMLLGGPAGIALLAAWGIWEFAKSLDTASSKAKRLRSDIDNFKSALIGLSSVQLEIDFSKAHRAVATHSAELRAAKADLERYSVAQKAASDAWHRSPDKRGMEKISFAPQIKAAQSEVERLSPMLGVAEAKRQALFDARLEGQFNQPEVPAMKRQGLGPDSLFTDNLKAEVAAWKRASQIYKETRTPLENLQATYKELNLLLEKGVITQDTYRRAVLKSSTSYEEMATKVKDQSSAMSVYADQAARNMQDSFANFLFDPFDDGLKGMLKGFLDVIRRIAAEQAASTLFRSKSEGGMGLGDLLTTGIMAGLGSFGFGGAGSDVAAPATDIRLGLEDFKIPGLAKGGRAAAGKVHLVGEEGPELMVPDVSGTVIPNNQIGGRNITVIQNISTPAAGSFRKASSRISLDISRQLARV